MKFYIYVIAFSFTFSALAKTTETQSDRFKSPHSSTYYVTNLDQFEYFCTTDTKQDLLDIILGNIYVDVDFKEGSKTSPRLVSKYPQDLQENYFPGTFVVGPEMKIRSFTQTRCGLCNMTLVLDDDEDDISYRLFDTNGRVQSEIKVNGKIYGRGTCEKLSKKNKLDGK